jgi:DNA-binding cell septation regulator SpoVG
MTAETPMEVAARASEEVASIVRHHGPIAMILDGKIAVARLRVIDGEECLYISTAMMAAALERDEDVPSPRPRPSVERMKEMLKEWYAANEGVR